MAVLGLEPTIILRYVLFHLSSVSLVGHREFDLLQHSGTHKKYSPKLSSLLIPNDLSVCPQEKDIIVCHHGKPK